MGKNNKDEQPSSTSVQNRDVIQRLNFLYQAGVYLSSLNTHAPTPSASTGNTYERKRSNAKRSKDPQTVVKRAPRGDKFRTVTAGDLSKEMVQSMRIVGRKTTVKIDPSVKRTICKQCNTVLVPGLTASVRTKRSTSHQKAITFTCLDCNTSSSFPAPSLSVSGPSPATSKSLSLDHKHSEDRPPDRPSKIQESGPKAQQLPPLFANRDAGHVILNGNALLQTDDIGSGLFTF